MAPPVELIRHVDLFADLRRPELERIADAFQEREFGAGDTITEEGATGTAFFVIGRGRATVLVQGHVVATLSPGDTFGEVGLVDEEHRRSATVQAETDLLAYTLTLWDFEPILDAYPSVARQLLRILALRLRRENRSYEPADEPG